MRYQDTVAQSAEYLRLAVPLMSRQAAALHPLSYAVWYEYVSGRNQRLKQAVDDLLRDGRVLDESAVDALYAAHIAELDEQTATRIATGFQRVIENMSESAAQAGSEASRFGDSLAQWSGNLAASGAASDSEQLLHGTREMQGAMASLKNRLDESRSEVERLREEVHQAREDALLDALTGLTNRRGFDQALEACIAAASPEHKGPSLLIADIDHFKNVNDTYGHLFGDKVIRAVAHILKQNIKGKDTAARFGGEEFVVLLPDTPLVGASVLAENIRATVAASRIRRPDNQHDTTRITLSFGVAGYKQGESASEFIGRVDRALYISKSQGRNRVTLADLTPAAASPAPAPVAKP